MRLTDLLIDVFNEQYGLQLFLFIFNDLPHIFITFIYLFIFGTHCHLNLFIS